MHILHLHNCFIRINLLLGMINEGLVAKQEPIKPIRKRTAAKAKLEQIDTIARNPKRTKRQQINYDKFQMKNEAKQEMKIKLNL